VTTPHERACDLCHAAGVELYPSQASLGRARHVRCIPCGLVWASPVPDWPNEEVYGGPPRERRDRLARHRRFLSRLRSRTTSPSPRLLDVGCGGGELLVEAEAAGFEAHGVDLSPDRVAEARERGVRAEVGRLEDCPALLPGPYDVVRMNQVLEHVVSPRALLLAVASRLAPGGEVHLATPNIDSLVHAVREGGWRQLGRRANGHLVLVGPRAVARYGAETGLEVVALRTRGARAWSQSRPSGPGRRALRLVEQALEPWVRLRGRGGVLEAVLRKPGEGGFTPAASGSGMG
jgi:SAM-dependent methyltransferase